MIDGHFSAWTNRFWEWLAGGLVRRRWSPNAVTLAGAALVLLACAAYLWHRNGWIFGTWLALAFAFDGLDGAVARLSGRSSHLGGYLDAVTDRYQEIAVLAAVAYVHHLWPEAFFAITGSLMISYNKARVAMEMPTGNGDWPDLLERLERLALLVLMLLISETARRLGGPSDGYLQPALIVFALLVHASALQRFWRACRRIGVYDRRDDVPPS